MDQVVDGSVTDAEYFYYYTFNELIIFFTFNEIIKVIL